MARRSLLFSVIFLLSSGVCRAESMDFLRSMGKMYSVIGVIVILFLVILIYLITLDRKITKIENQNMDHE